MALQKHVETTHADISEEEQTILKQNLMSNPLLLAGLSGQILDSSITDLLKRESFRMDCDESVDEESSNKDGDDGPMTVGAAENSDDEDETYKEQFIEDYLNSQAVAKENYNDPTRKYKCHKCKMAFTRQSYLTLHNKKVPHRKGEKVIYPMEKYLDPNRPYKCEVCKESFTQKNILLVHYNSVSHLHKLKRATQDSQNNSGASLASSPGNASGGSSLMISPLNMNINQVDRKKLPQDLYCTPVKSNMLPSTSPVNDCAQNNSQGSQIASPTTAIDGLVANATSSPIVSSAPHGMISCSRCNALFVNQEQLQTHQQLYCMFGSPMSMFPALSGASPTAFTQSTDGKTPSLPDEAFMKFPSQAKKSSHMYKHLLESFGFDLVMQFNENHQRRQRKEREENERLLAELQSAQIMPEETPVLEAKKDNNVTDSQCKDEKEETPPADKLPEVSKSTCAHCNKEFSSVWVLKAHCEEVHKDLVPLDFLEKYAQQIKCEIEKKVVPGSVPSNAGNEADANANNADSKCEENASASVTTTADVGTDAFASHRDDRESCDDNGGGALNMSTNASAAADNSMYDSERENDDNKESAAKMSSARDSMVTPNPPTACSTPASSTESIPPTVGGVTSGNPSPNIPMSLAQQMNEMQAALNAMAATQLQQQLQQFNPMMMGMAGLGITLPLGLTPLAAMNLQPPLVPMMMPPPSFDPMVGLGPAQNALFSQQSSNMDATSILAKQQQHLLQQQQVVSTFTFRFS
jgi:AT-binding transcription factor 1